jgi:hypothetical protein
MKEFWAFFGGFAKGWVIGLLIAVAILILLLLF